MAVLTTFTIGGTSVVNLAQVQTLRIEKRLSARSVASFIIRDADGDSVSYRPTVGQQVIIVLDGVTEFLGIVWQITETHVINTRGIQLNVSCVDYAALLENTYFNGPIPGGLLRDVITPLVQNLSGHGITLDPGMAAGPTVGDQSLPFVSIANAFNDLSLQSAWAWKVSAGLGTNQPIVGFYNPGTLPAPANFTTNVGSVERAQFLRDRSKYVNEVWVRYGEGTVEVTQRLAGDGSRREWVLENALSQLPATLQVTRTGGVVSTETVDANYVSGTAQWHYDPANTWNQRFVHDASQAVLLSGEYADLTYIAQYPNAVLALANTEWLTNGPYTRIEDLPNVFDRATALAYAQAVLRRLGGQPRTGTIRTAVAGYGPLQTVTINLPLLQVNSAAFLITQVVMSHRTSALGAGGSLVHHFGYDVTAVEGNEGQGNWIDFYLPQRRNRGFGVVDPNGAGGVGGSTPPNTSPAPEYVTTGMICAPTAARGAAVSTAAGAAWTNTAWVELLSAANAPTEFWAIEGLHAEALNVLGEAEYDIGLGPSGSEQVYATIRIGGNTQQNTGLLWLPIPMGPIAPNTRVAVRMRMRAEIGGTSAVVNTWVKVLYYTSVPAGITTTTRTLKVSPASSLVTVTTPASAWTNGSWVQVTAATTENWNLSGVCITEADLNFDGSGDEIEIDIGTGPAASEIVRTTVRIHVRQSAVVSQGIVLDPVLTGAIPIGSRVAVRARHRRAVSWTFNFALQYYGGTL